MFNPVEFKMALSPYFNIQVDDFLGVEGCLHVGDCFFRGLQDRVEPSKHSHRQNHVTIFAPNVQIAENVVRNPPDEVCYPAQIAVAHSLPSMKPKPWSLLV